MDFGSRLREARKNKKLTQEDVSRDVDVDFTTISKYENNRSEPDNATLLKMADLYGVSIDYLMGRDVKDEDEATPDAEHLSSHTDSSNPKGEHEVDHIAAHLEGEYGIDDPNFTRFVKNIVKSVVEELDEMKAKDKK